MKTKQHAGTMVKSVGEGTARVAFAQLNVVDHDNDYTLPGAFQAGQKVKVCQTGHAHAALPAGAGTIVGEESGPDGSMWAVADLKFFLDTPQGDATYRTVKALAAEGHTQEWSYGYDVLDAGPIQVDGRAAQALKSLSVYEISPVLRGAGIGTHTLDVKSADGKTCDACGQQIPKAADEDATGDDPAETCPECDKPIEECECDADAGAKRRAADAFVSWLAIQARGFSSPV